MKALRKILTIVILAVFLLFINVVNAGDEDMLQQIINVNGEDRTFYVHLPPDYSNDKELPVVVLFHGTVADANKIKNYTKFNDFADKNGIIAVYPEYTGDWDWNLDPAEKSREVPFASEIVNYMIKNYNADSKRIYQMGYSSGAEMSYILACTIPDKFAAFAPVAGNLRKSFADGCRSLQPVPMLLIHGTKDPYEVWEGNLKKEMLSVDETISFWKKRNACSGAVKELIYPQKPDNNSTIAKLITDNSCKDDSEVSILKIEGGGHTWPGASTSPRIETFLGKTNYDVDANEIIWEFFQRHKLK